MTTTEMRQAMSTLKQFSDKDQDYHAYQARQNYLREQLTREHEYEETRKARDEAVLREQAALKEIDRLKALLAQNNLH
jgi:hypothetical protein